MGPSAESLIMDLYEYRQPSQHDSEGNVVHPFQDVPKQLMKELDKMYLELKSETETDSLFDE